MVIGEKAMRGKRKQVNISLTPECYYYLSRAKENFEKMTHLRTSWGAFLIAISSGALAAQAISGLRLRCPNCEHGMTMKITQLRVVEEEDSSEPSPASSKGQPVL